MKVADAIEREVVTVDEGTSVAEASMSMRAKGEGFAIVLKQGKPYGMVTERDVTWKVAANGLDPKTVKVDEIMSTPLITIDADKDLVEAAKIMNQNRIRRLVVLKDGVFHGVLTASGIARHLEGYMDQEVRDILNYLRIPRYYPDTGPPEVGLPP